MEYFVACPKGIEELLSGEMSELGAEAVRLTVAGVYAQGDLAFAYRACLWSRVANRVLLPLEKFAVADADDLYERCRVIDWPSHFQQDASFAVQFTGVTDEIRNTQYGAQRVKDAIVDRLRDEWGFRPEVDGKDPDILINVRLTKNKWAGNSSGKRASGKAVVSLDLSGGSLHKRGYRASMVAAPLKENLAAALLLRAGWPEIARNGGALIDPLCGSGTFLIEGAMIAADIAPSLGRKRFGFEHWEQHDEELWALIRQEAVDRKNRGLSAGLPEIRGYDKDTRATEAAETNILHAGLSQWVRVSPKPVQAFKKPTHKQIDKGLVMTNPPYGERWGEVDALRPLYQALGQKIKEECGGWTLAVFTGNPDLAGELRLRSTKKYKLFNGTIPTQLCLYQLRDEPIGKPVSEAVDVEDQAESKADSPWNKRQASAVPAAEKQPSELQSEAQSEHSSELQSELPSEAQPDLPSEVQSEKQPWQQAKERLEKSKKAVAQEQEQQREQPDRLSAGAIMLVNRLKKNHSKLKSWLVQDNISCYRLYDADLPEYAVAIDIYSQSPVGKKMAAGAIHVQEYAPPATIDVNTANKHLSEVRKALLSLFPENREQMFFKERRKQKGRSQYNKQRPAANSERGKFVVPEGKAKLEVSLAEYLDTGVFLDHRPVRQLIGDIADDARFLNLFCYTGTATVQAAVHGAQSSVSVDMSNSYLEWAKRNFVLNNIDPYRHRLVREDCISWLEQAVRKLGTDEESVFDLIFLDPPTFSNSSKMNDVLDIQRDHAALIRNAMALLSDKGVLLFSNNFRKFKMSEDIVVEFDAEDMTRQTIPPDFSRNEKIHHCWVIRHDR